MKNPICVNSVILAISMGKVIREFHFDSVFKNKNNFKFKDENNNAIIFDSSFVDKDNKVRPLDNQDILKEFKHCEFFLETDALIELLVRRQSINEVTTNLCKIGNTITRYNISSKDFKDINEKINNLFEEINNKYGVC